MQAFFAAERGNFAAAAFFDAQEETLAVPAARLILKTVATICTGTRRDEHRSSVDLQEGNGGRPMVVPTARLILKTVATICTGTRRDEHRSSVDLQEGNGGRPMVVPTARLFPRFRAKTLSGEALPAEHTLCMVKGSNEA